MIRQLRGVVVEVEEDSIVVEVNQVGYLIHLCESDTVLTPGEEVYLHTHLAVKENALDLYGFSNRDALTIFTLLLSLPKIGPKSAQHILQNATTSLIREAVAKQDASYLSKLSGIGKKSAEKIVMGLKDKLEDVVEVGDSGVNSGDSINSPALSDTIDALISLGYEPEEARTATKEIAKENPEETDTNKLLKLSLAKLSH